jgi:predicted AAA+ superfamily ATPase
MYDVKRNIENKIISLLEQFPAVAILGARQCGKTTIAKRVAPNWQYIDLENPKDYDRITYDPLFFLSQYNSHIIIDEAQEYPILFRTLREIIDEKRHETGRFILTSSSSPNLLNHISETLAGRIAIIELGTLKANEYYEKPLSPFYDLFKEKLSINNLVSGQSPLSVKQMQHIWIKGGYPEPTLKKDKTFYELWMENYRKTYIERDIAKLFPHLNKIAYRRFLMILSKLSGTIINKRDTARAIEVSEKTIREYLTIAEGTFLWRQTPSFEKNIIKSVIKMPKGHIRDTGLLHNLLGISDKEKLYEHPMVGKSFETFVIEELITGLQATMITNWFPYYYRTRSGSEIDLILDGPFGTLPIEIKYGSTTKLKDLFTLSNFVEEHNLPMGIVINQSDNIEWFKPKIIQIPVGWL